MYSPNYYKPHTREHKDSLLNVEETGEFVYNMCTYELKDQMIVTSKHSPRSYDEMAEAGLDAVPCETVRPPRLKASPVVMECKYLQTIELESPGEGARATSVIGQVVRIHVNDDYITPDGLIDMYKLRPLAGLGYYDYAVIEGSQLFQVKTPDDDRFSGDDSKGWEQAAGVE